MHRNLHEFLNHTEGISYFVALLVLLLFIPFWRFLVERERKT